LRAKEELGSVTLVVVVESLETVGAESDGGCGGEVEVAAVEKIEEAVLQHLCPDLEVLEVGTTRGEAANNSVGNIANSGLHGSEVFGEATVLYLMLQVLDDVGGVSMINQKVVQGSDLRLLAIFWLVSSSGALG